jgi:hypothetical protein
MLNGHVEPLRLAAPVDARPVAAASANGATPVARSETVKPVETVTATAAPGEVIELSLFPGIMTPSSPPLPTSSNGKHAPIESGGAAVVSAPPSGAAQTPSSPAASTKPEATAPAPAKISSPEPVANVATPEQVVAPAPVAHVAAPAPTAQVAASPPAASAPAAQIAAPPEPRVAAAASTISDSVTPPVAQAAVTATPRQEPAPSPAAAPAAAAPAPTAPQVTEPAKVEPPQVSAAAPPASPAQTTTPASPAQPSSATTPAPAKLTPYAPSKWNGKNEADVSISTPVVMEHPVPAKVIRERQLVDSAPRQRAAPAGFIIGGLALVALVVAGILFKPTSTTQSPSTSAVSVATPVLAVNSAPATQHVQHTRPVTLHKQPTVVQATAPAKVQAATPTPHPVASVAPTATPRAATPPPTAAPATPKPAAQKAIPTWQTQAPAPVHHPRPAQAESGSVVALGGIEAYYGPRGRAVRVLWSADAQASASVQLIDDRGTTVNTASVRGGRQSVLMYLPKGYRGGVTVQVSSIGKLGERVAQTTSLPAFGR